MTEPIDWAPYASDGDHFKIFPPQGITYCLTTDDISGAKTHPSIRRYLHGEIGDKMFPETWIPQDPFRRLKAARSLQTDRLINPLDPNYKLPSGDCLIPSGEQIFSKRVTNLLDTSDIPGTKAGPLYKRPLRSCNLDSCPDEIGFHPAKRTHIRTRVSTGQGLDLYDINIGKIQFGFRRRIVSNPLEPIYPNELEETCEEKHLRMKKKILLPPKNKVNAMEKLLDKIYWKAEQLPCICRDYDQFGKNRISHDHFRQSLEQFGVVLSDEDFHEILSFADKEHTGSVKYKNFARALRNMEGLERRVPKRIGFDTGGLTTNTSLGQGLQVLVESPHKGKRIWNSPQQHCFNPLTGEPTKGSLPFIANREPLCFSYAEQSAALSNQQHHLTFASFMPAEPVHIKIPPIVPMDRNLRKPAFNILPAVGISQQPLINAEHTDSFMEQKSRTPLKGNSASAMPSEQLEDQVENVLTLQKHKSPLAIRKKTIQELKKEQIQFPHLSRYQYAHSSKLGESLWKSLNSKRLSPQPLKQRLIQEQRSADLQAVQILN